MVNTNLAIPGVRCQTLGLKIPGSDYVGDADHSVSGNTCLQWNDYEIFYELPENQNWRHNKCRNFVDSIDGAWCYVKDGILVKREQCNQIPGILFAPILKIKLD